MNTNDIIQQTVTKVNPDFMNLDFLKNMYAKKIYILNKLNLESFQEIDVMDLKCFDMQNSVDVLIAESVIVEHGFFESEAKGTIRDNITKIFKNSNYDVFWLEGLSDVIYEFYNNDKIERIYKGFNELKEFDIDKIIEILRLAGANNEQ